MPQASNDRPLHDAEKHALTKKIERLTTALEQILRTYPDGVDEHTLLKKLQAPEWAILGAIDFRDPAKLYPVHFLLFHALYRLRDYLVETRAETLSISALNIAIRSRRGGVNTALPGPADELASFYLDLDNLRLSTATIEGMLDDFWRGVQRPQPRSGKLEQACSTLDMSYPPEDLAVANLQFRRLAMTHHPDRGGDKHRLQQINQAIAVVRQYFRHPV